jgi:hypothetical protein
MGYGELTEREQAAALIIGESALFKLICPKKLNEVARRPNESAIRQIQPVPPYAPGNSPDSSCPPVCPLRPPRYGLSREGICRLVRPERRLRKLRSQSATLHRQGHPDYFVFESYVIAPLTWQKPSDLEAFGSFGSWGHSDLSDLGDRSDVRGSRKSGDKQKAGGRIRDCEHWGHGSIGGSIGDRSDVRGSIRGQVGCEDQM